MLRVITLTTDFGLPDPFVGTMKDAKLGLHRGAPVRLQPDQARSSDGQRSLGRRHAKGDIRIRQTAGWASYFPVQK